MRRDDREEWIRERKTGAVGKRREERRAGGVTSEEERQGEMERGDEKNGDIGTKKTGEKRGKKM